jgi:hypothetical protein
VFEDDPNEDSFEETVRSIVREVSRSIERVTQGDFDDVADALGVDLVRAKEVAESAVAWLRAHERRTASAGSPDRRTGAGARCAGLRALERRAGQRRARCRRRVAAFP